jgi:cytochrome bd ubiquinol oxidase subunit I
VDEALFARGQMALSLGFHIVFAAIGIAMPVLMVAADIQHQRTGDPEYLALAKRWAKGTAVFFAVGAVSGTVLSFELGLLFPGFMKHAGAVVGFPFSLEGFAFFTEAIFLGLYLYGRGKISPRAHIASGIVVALSGLASAVFVTLVNAWMNAPRGFSVGPDGRMTNIDPIAALFTPFAASSVIHMALAAYLSTAIAVAAVHAGALLRLRRVAQPKTRGFHEKALRLALLLAVPTALAQPIVGHWAGQVVAEHQPLKLAAMEQLASTQAMAPVSIGPIEVPGMLSILAFNDPDAVVRGLDEWPEADRPHPIVKLSFLVMVALGSALAGLAAWAVLLWLRKKPWSRAFLMALVVAAPMGFVCIEAGWIVTEVGRQPWVIYGFLRTNDAVTPMRGLVVPFVTFTAVYVVLSLIVFVVLRRQVLASVEVDVA